MTEVHALGGGTERPRTVLVGCGGAGCNTLHVVPAIPELELLAVNDLPHPSLIGLRRRLLIEKAGLRGIAQMDTKAVRALATTSEQAVAVELADADFVVPIAGLGGEMGSWGASLVSRVASLKRAATMAVVTVPFSAEGPNRRAVAQEALTLLRTQAHGVLTLANDGLLRIAPHLPLLRAFEVMSRIAVQPVLDLLQVVTREDLPVLESVLRAARDWRLGIGEGTRDHPELAAVEAAFRSPWIPRAAEEAVEAIVIASVPEGDEKSAREILHEVNLRTPRASVLWGAASVALHEPVRVTVLLGF